jgi:trehalose synthase
MPGPSGQTDLPRLDGLTHVPIDALPVDRFQSVLTEAQMREVREAAERARNWMAGRVIWHVNSTAKGGGVAEMLNALLPYTRGAGVDTRWLVIEGDAEFFRVTKRLHNHLHGGEGDSPLIDDADRRHYEELTAARAEAMRTLIERDDFVVLHDPQTAGMGPPLAARCSAVVWRCHVGVDAANALVRSAWDFLRPYVRAADGLIFSRREFVWDGLDEKPVDIIAPSIDPFSAKNRMIDAGSVAAILDAAGIVPGSHEGRRGAFFERQDGSRSALRHPAELREVRPLASDAPLVLQVSRWDRLKDPMGVMEGFAAHVLPRADSELMLAGPSVREVADDPEGHAVFAEIERSWEALPARERERVHLACLPMDDEEENAAMVNALQRRADVVVQKSLAEGFGLTVAEAMWKSRPVVASAVGGIQDQIEDGVSGVLVHDPGDLLRFGEAVTSLLGDPTHAASMGRAAHDRVREHFLGVRAMIQYLELLMSLRR